MKTQRFALLLTAVNLLILATTLSSSNSVTADGIAPILRGRELQIVDEQGRVRASIKIHPEDNHSKLPDGSVGYPETVMLRLIDGKGRPEVKIGGSELGGKVGLLGATDSTQVLLEADGKVTSLKLRNDDGTEQRTQPSK